MPPSMDIELSKYMNIVKLRIKLFLNFQQDEIHQIFHLRAESIVDKNEEKPLASLLVSLTWYHPQTIRLSFSNVLLVHAMQYLVHVILTHKTKLVFVSLFNLTIK